MTILEWATLAWLAICFVLVLVWPGEPRWSSRPWFVKGPPKQRYAIAFFGFVLLAAVLHVLGDGHL
jgi:hypothetical protein